MERTFAEKYDVFSCVQCGKCTGGCPVSLKSSLNVRELVYTILLGEEPASLTERADLWDCTTCSTCALRCPKGVKPVEMLIALRCLIVEGGRIQPTLRDALESVFKYGNPWGRIRERRTEWARELDIRVIEKGEQAEVLYFVGCTPAYDPRVQEVARALVRALDSADVDYATLGDEESCCGNEIRRIGEEGLFDMLVEDNLALFEQYDFRRMVTISPHCYNTFKNDYPTGKLEVEHYTQLVARLIREGKLVLSERVEQTTAFHDPCFLGKQNQIYEEPRYILSRIPGLTLLELDRSRERGLCCEGGGGRMWIEATGKGERLAEARVRQAVDQGIDVLATACPFCLLTLEDAVKTTGNEEKIAVRDIMELVAEALSKGVGSALSP